jgi:hypothetical protein
MASKFDIDSWLGKIRALLASAESMVKGGNTLAAESFREKAEALMIKFRIEEEQLIADAPGSIKPIRRDVDLCEWVSEFRNLLYLVWLDIAEHTGIRTHVAWGNGKLTAQAIGYDQDLRYADMLFTAASLVFAANLTPEVDPKLSDKENIYRLRSAGIDRQKIALLVWGHNGHHEGIKVGRLYKEFCAEKGEEATVSGRGVSAKTYREAYARGFRDNFDGRLRRARDAAGAQGGNVELHGRADRVEEAFYSEFPSERPEPVTEGSGSPEKARKAKGITKSDQAKFHRLYGSETAHAARSAGRVAANRVQLTRGQHTDRIEESSGLEIES